MQEGNILLGVCGGIGIYKVCGLLRLLVKDGFAVKVVMTEAATKFVNPLVFQELSHNPVYLEMFSLERRENIVHVSLAHWARLCVLAPLSANTLSKIAHGICDNLLTAVVCGLPQKVKVLLVPAMDEEMWKNPIIQQNVEKLKGLKRYIFFGPVKGKLASGKEGEGRLPEPEEIHIKIKELLR